MTQSDKVIRILFVTGVQAIRKEVETSTDATISCVITGVSQKLDAVTWQKDGTNVRTLSETDYIVNDGTYDSNSQTTTLTVKAAANVADATYTCLITSDDIVASIRVQYVVVVWIYPCYSRVFC